MASLDMQDGRVENLAVVYAQADEIDRREGELAYARYRYLLDDLAHLYDFPLERVVAAFAALSPNSDYVGNLRSLVSVLRGMREGIERDRVTVSTYRHCRDRAWSYLDGSVDFLARVKGPKIRSFYRNIIDPHDRAPVTIDSHMVGIWMRARLVMKDAAVSRRQYEVVADGVREFARVLGLIPNQLQATLWFARKRALRVKYDGQHDLFNMSTDNVWRTLVRVGDIVPYRIVA